MDRSLRNRAGQNANQEEVRTLHARHEELEAQLKALDGHRYLTSAERVERKRIQKQKLLIKDRIRLLQRKQDQ